MAFWNKQGSKDGLSAKQADEVSAYLKKVHEIDREVFKNLHDYLAIVDEIGIEGADEELDRIRSLAPKLEQLAAAEQDHQIPKKQVRQAQVKLIRFEHNLAQLLKKSRKKLADQHQAEKWIKSIDSILQKLVDLVEEEEQLLAA